MKRLIMIKRRVLRMLTLRRRPPPASNDRSHEHRRIPNSFC